MSEGPPPDMAEVFPFVPPLFVEQLFYAVKQGKSLPIAVPYGETREGAVLCIDLSGFTNLSTSYGVLGEAGAEKYADVVAQVLAACVPRVWQERGEVLRFAGDLILSSFDCIGRETMGQAVARALDCANACIAVIEETSDAISPDLQLTAHCGVGCGPICLAHVGADGYRENLMLGGALQQASAALGKTSQAEIGVTEEARRWAGDISEHKFNNRGLLIRGKVELKEISQQIINAQVRAGQSIGTEPLEAYIADGTLQMLGRDLKGSKHRELTIVFVSVRPRNEATGLDEIGTGLTEDDLVTINEAYATMRTATEKYGGYVRQFMVDDKGMTFIAAWGLQKSEHDEVRAVRATLEMVNELQELDMAINIGIDSGYCVARKIGTEQRCELAIIGKHVNMAARIMEYVAQNGVAVSHAIFEKSNQHVKFTAAGEHKMKGLDVPLACYKAEHMALRMATVHACEGRDDEMEIIVSALKKVENGEGSTIHIYGVPGMGKSTLVMAAVQNTSVDVIQSACFVLDQGTPCFCICQLLHSLLGTTPQTNARLLSKKLGKLCMDISLDAQYISQVPLLEDVGISLHQATIQEQFVDVDLLSHKDAKSMDPEAKSANTERLFLEIFIAAAWSSAYCLVFEDIQWIDEQSYRVLAELSRGDVGALIVTSRPPTTVSTVDSSATVNRILPNEVAMHLTAWNREQSETFIKSATGVDNIPSEFFKRLHGYAAGVPRYLHEMSSNAIEAGAVFAHEQEIMVVDLNRVGFSQASLAIVQSQIDALGSQRDQDTLMMASCIGHVFDKETLWAVIKDNTTAVDGDEDHLSEALQRLEYDADMVEEQEDGTYKFRSALIQEGAYRLLAPSKKVQNHSFVADLFANKPGRTENASLLHWLSKHWQAAGEEEKSLQCLVEAATAAKALAALGGDPDIEAAMKAELQTYAFDASEPANATEIFAEVQRRQTSSVRAERSSSVAASPKISSVKTEVEKKNVPKEETAEMRKLGELVRVVAYASTGAFGPRRDLMAAQNALRKAEFALSRSLFKKKKLKEDLENAKALEGIAHATLDAATQKLDAAMTAMLEHAIRNGPFIKRTPMDLSNAARSGDHVGAKRMLGLGVDPNDEKQVSPNKSSPLFWACCNGHIDCVSALLQGGAKVETTDERAFTPLIGTAANGHTDAVAALLEAGADVNAVSSEGYTALLRASMMGHTEVVRQLLGAGADKHLADNTGDTARDKALAKHNTHIVTLLDKWR